MTVRVLVVDDQALVRAGFSAILDVEDDIRVVGEVDDGEGVAAAVTDLEPDVVLMDIRMPRVDGVEATRRLQARGQGAPRVLMLTTFDLDEYLYDAMKAGAAGFILKDAPRAELVAAVRAVAAGETVLAPRLVERLVTAYVAQRRPGEAEASRLSNLTSREREVFRHVGRGLSNGEIARALYLSEATVRTHLTHIFEKLGVRDRVQAVVLAYESGEVSVGGDVPGWPSSSADG